MYRHSAFLGVGGSLSQGPGSRNKSQSILCISLDFSTPWRKVISKTVMFAFSLSSALFGNVLIWQTFFTFDTHGSLVEGQYVKSPSSLLLLTCLLCLSLIVGFSWVTWLFLCTHVRLVKGLISNRRWIVAVNSRTLCGNLFPSLLFHFDFSTFWVVW